MFEGIEIDQVVDEMRRVSEMASPNFLIGCQVSIDPDGYRYDYGVSYSNLRPLRRHVAKKKTERKRSKCESGLIAKVLCLRWSKHLSETYWGQPCLDNLDDTIELFVDGLVPLNCDDFLGKIDHILKKANCFIAEPSDFRKCVDRSITRI